MEVLGGEQLRDTHAQQGFDFKVLFQIEPPIFILEFHSKL